MRLLDRYIIRSFLFNYLLAFGVLVGVYVLLDLIINFDRFTKAVNVVTTTGPAVTPGSMKLFATLLGDIADYYGYQLLVIFQQVSSAIPLLAAGFTMVRMTRHHELTAMLASGVSLYRVATPIVICAAAFSLLVVVDQEVLMPANADKLLRKHEEVSGGRTKAEPLFFVRDDGDNSLLIASSYDSGSKTLTDVRIVMRNEEGVPVRGVMAPTAVWDPTYDNHGLPGRWVLENARQIDMRPGVDPTQKVAEKVGTAYRTTKLTPKQLELISSKKAVEFLSSSQVQDLWQYSPDLTKPALEKIMHARFTGPIMNLIMLLLGIPFLLTREPRQLIPNMMYCTLISGVCFVSTFVLTQMAGPILPPMLGTWLPVLVFGPISVMMLDTIKT